MARIEVRCCCQPTKVFGTMDVHDSVANGGKFVVPFLDKSVSLHDWDAPVRTEEIEVKPFSIGLVQRYAVYSDDRPLEFWRGLPSFIESPAK